MRNPPGGLKAGIDLTGLRDSPLLVAANKNRLTVLRYLIGLGVFPGPEMEDAAEAALLSSHAKALSMFLAAGASLRQPVDLDACAFSNSSRCLYVLMGRGFDPQPHVAGIIATAVLYQSHRMLRFVLEKFQVNQKTLSDVLLLATSHRSTRMLKILISAGATCPVKCTEAFNAALLEHRTPFAALLLPYVDATQVTAVSLGRLVRSSQWKLLRQLLTQGPLAPGIQLSTFEAWRLVRHMRPEDFLRRYPASTGKAIFQRERLCLSRNLADSAPHDSFSAAITAAFWWSDALKISQEI